ncbi:MAG: peptide deformylase [Actinobacteria bacterium HGW-Actinobacteria-7]|jgi:peptide deformylase|nr:MAG: peptide deformylase [Actinobacteria bacterium HGW-Actinobacteria-7]
MDVLAHPNPALAQDAAEVDPAADETLRDLARRMARVMYQFSGIGLAATQIGVLKRVIVYDLSDDGSGLVALCNPAIVERSGECEIDDEGCLSVPGISVAIERACEVTCEALSLDGTKVTIEADGLLARLLQHEIDHLNGMLIIDRVEGQDRKDALRRYREAVDAGALPGETSI